jgi:hypothetical protein
MPPTFKSTFVIPPFSIPSLFPEPGGRRRYKPKKPKYKYQPSFAALTFGIKGKPLKFNVGGETAYGPFRPIISSAGKTKSMKLPKMKAMRMKKIKF